MKCSNIACYIGKASLRSITKPCNMSTNIYFALLKHGNKNSTCSHKCRSNSAGEMSTAATILVAVILHLCGIVCVRWAWLIFKRRVISALLIFIRYYDCQRRTGSTSFIFTADYLKIIRLHSRGRGLSARAPFCQSGPYSIIIYLNPGSKTVNHRADIFTVALAEKRQRKIVSKSILHHLPPVFFITKSAKSERLILEISHLPISCTSIISMPSLPRFLSA